MSNVGPLTTTFTAPASCTTATGLYQIWNDAGTYRYEQGPLATMSGCFPDGYGASLSRYYSPGLCPSGYTAACSSTDAVVSATATATETAFTCCPTGVDYTCAASSTPGQAYLGCTTTFGEALVIAGVTAVSGGSSYPTSTTEPAGNGIGANSIAVRFRSADFGTTAEQEVATPTPSLKWTTSCPTATSSSAASGGAGLSTAGIAGVSAAGGVLLLGSLLGFLLCVRRRRNKALKSQLQPTKPPPPQADSQSSRPLSRPPPPPPKDMRAWLASPSPPPGDGRDFKKPYPALRSWDSKSTFVDSAHGPYELAGAANDEKDTRPYELYGEWPAPPTSTSASSKLVSPGRHNWNLGHDDKIAHQNLAPPISASPDPLRSNPGAEAAPPTAKSGNLYWSSPPNHGAQQPAGLVYAPPRSARTAHHHRRTISERWGTSWYPAELEGGAV